MGLPNAKYTYASLFFLRNGFSILCGIYGMFLIPHDQSPNVKHTLNLNYLRLYLIVYIIGPLSLTV